jgi:hypothetical protein
MLAGVHAIIKSGGGTAQLDVGGILGVLQGIIIVYVACVFLQLALLLSGDRSSDFAGGHEATILLKSFSRRAPEYSRRCRRRLPV